MSQLRSRPSAFLLPRHLPRLWVEGIALTVFDQKYISAIFLFAFVLSKIRRCRMICLIECLDQVGMLFLSDLSRQKCTKYTGQQGFDVPDSPTGHGEEERFFADNKHRWRQRSHCRQSTRNQTTIVRTADRVRGSDKIYRTAFRVHGVSHFTDRG